MERTARRFVEPKQCLYWRKPDKVRGSSQDPFEVQETYIDDNHWRRSLLKCLECGQLYFYEFYETVDYVGGNDPQYRKYIPVSAPDEALTLLDLSPSELNLCSPCLCVDWPSDLKKPKVFWVGAQPNPDP